MNVANNARSLASQGRIKQAYLGLLETAPADRVTVREVCERAGVNRTTFYAHYGGLPDLLESIEEDVLGASAVQLLGDPPDAANMVSGDAMARALTHMRQHAPFYLASLSSPTESRLVRRLSNQVKSAVMPYLHRGGTYTPDEFDYQFEFCKAGALAVIRSWLTGGCQEPVETVASLLAKVARRCMM